MIGSPPSGPRRGARVRRTSVIVALASVAVACSDSDGTSTEATIPSVDASTSTSSEPTDDSSATSDDGTSSSTTSVSTSSTTPSTTPGTTVETTTTTSTVPVTTTTEPLAISELLLRGDGFGSAVFGADPQGVIDYVTSIIGGNTADTGWVDPFTFAACDGTEARRVDWGVLSLLFGDLSSYADGRRHFIGWEYGRVGSLGDDPVGLRTPGGVTLGSRVVDLLAEFPDASVNEGEDDLGIPPNFFVSENFRGLLTGTSPEDVVTVMFGGYGCAE